MINVDAGSIGGFELNGITDRNRGCWTMTISDDDVQLIKSVEDNKNMCLIKMYDVQGIPEDKITVKTEFINSTRSTYIIIEGFFKNENLDVEKYATKTVYGYYEKFDIKQIVLEMVNLLSVKPTTISDMIGYQVEFMGYADYTDPNFDWRYVAVMNLNTKYSPKFTAYCINNGKTLDIKVSKNLNYKNKKIKTAFNKVPFKDGEVLYLTSLEKKQKVRKTADGFEDVPGEFDWWAREYRVVNI